MNIFEKHNQGLKAAPEGDTYHEQWVSGTYVVAGVFQRRGRLFTVGQVRKDIPALFESLRRNKKAIWPKGVCGYYAIPVYTADGFDQGLIDWVHARPRHKYAMWHEPVLYDRIRNTAETNASWGLGGRAFRIFLFEVIYTALHGLARKEGHSGFPIVNGERIRVEEAGQPAGG